MGDYIRPIIVAKSLFFIVINLPFLPVNSYKLIIDRVKQNIA